MESFSDNPFLTGLGIGLVVAVVAWIYGMLKARKLNKELKKSRDLVYCQAERLTESAQEDRNTIQSLWREREQLINKNLALQQEPNRQQLTELAVFKEAVGLLMREDPTFGKNWGLAREWAEHVVREGDKWRLSWKSRNEPPPFSLQKLNHKQEFIEGEVEEPPKKLP
jgi:gas vesicle protein